VLLLRAGNEGVADAAAGQAHERVPGG
jgi:hypothetical protein